MALSPSELEAEAGTVLPERDTLSFLHFGGNHSFVFAHNTSISANVGLVSALNWSGSSANQGIFVVQG